MHATLRDGCYGTAARGRLGLRARLSDRTVGPGSDRDPSHGTSNPTGLAPGTATSFRTSPTQATTPFVEVSQGRVLHFFWPEDLEQLEVLRVEMDAARRGAAEARAALQEREAEENPRSIICIWVPG